MQVQEVRDALAPYGLEPPDLEMLRPNEKRYQCLLLQPSGPVYADSHRIGSLDANAGAKKATHFLQLASKNGAHLAVTPEYFFSWPALQAALLDGIAPGPDALWVLGCESIRPDQLEAFKTTVAPTCEVINEPCTALAQDRPLLDPVVLLFQARRTDGTTRLVALVQFKTFPSRDNTFFEEGLLKRGTLIYRFRGTNGMLSVVTFTCSDAFALTDAIVNQLVDRSTLIHIQLNPDPRNSAYRQYRKTAFETDARTSECAIVCLNWSRSVVQHGADGATEEWSNIAGSAWYCPEADCTDNDAVVLPNHRYGLYYTHMREKRHALLLHYDEAIFELQVPKVVTIGKALLANRNGPSATQRYLWDANSSEWRPADEPADSGFNALLAANPAAESALAHVTPGASVLDVERLLALSAGAVAGTDNWFAAKEIDSCQIASDEIVRRITVAQDDDPAAVGFRHSRLEAIANVRHLLDTRADWPSQVAGLSKDARIVWNACGRNFNVLGNDGRPSLVAYVSESPNERALENIAAKLINLLRRAGGAHQTRLCIPYRRFGEVEFARLPGLTRFDDALNDETDILAVQPPDEQTGDIHGQH